jgi:hypothetical protein
MILIFSQLSYLSRSRVITKSGIRVRIEPREVGSGSEPWPEGSGERSTRVVLEVKSEEGDLEGKLAERDLLVTGIISDIANVVGSPMASVVLPSTMG